MTIVTNVDVMVFDQSLKGTFLQNEVHTKCLDRENRAGDEVTTFLVIVLSVFDKRLECSWETGFNENPTFSCSLTINDVLNRSQTIF